jgi:glycosyltransferase involved in cell wall biosynthesis
MAVGTRDIVVGARRPRARPNPMKLIIQIPCLDEAESLPRTLADLPLEVEGFDTVEWLVIDDGSTDGTAEVARLVAPILAGQADLVIGDRVIRSQDGFSPAKKALQAWGSWVVRQASGTDVADVTSGFRAYSREAAMRVNVVTRFTYTLETIIQAGKGDISVADVPIQTNPAVRPSRLFRSNRQYVRRSVATILRVYAVHEPMRVFMALAAVFGLAAAALFGRFAYFYVVEEGPTGHVQSLVVAAALAVSALLFAMLGVIGDLLRTNRLIAERTLRRVRAIELTLGVEAERLHDEPLDVERPRL